jgi:hypothetical protein
MPLLVTGQPVSVVPPPPIPPPQVQAQPQLFRNPFKMNSEVAKAALKVVPIVEKAAPVVASLSDATNEDDVDEHRYALAYIIINFRLALVFEQDNVLSQENDKHQIQI